MVWFSALAKVGGYLLAGGWKGEVCGKEEGSERAEVRVGRSER